MKKLVLFLILLGFSFAGYSLHEAEADDSCVFMLTADDVRPNVVFLLDNGAGMEHITWHSDFDNNIDFTPQVSVQIDAVDYQETASDPEPSTITLVLDPYDESDYLFQEGSDVEGVVSGAVGNVSNKSYVNGVLHLEVDSVNGSFLDGETVQRYKNKNNIATGTLTGIIADGGGSSDDDDDDDGPNGFFNDNGYAIVNQGGTNYLVKILDNLMPDTYSNGLAADYGSTWTINEKSIYLPSTPSTSVDSEGVKDNATIFRYSKNYLNWLFFYDTATDLNNDGTSESLYDYTDLPDKSRFYYAKKALMTVARMSSNHIYIGVWNFANDEGASNVQPLGLTVDTLVEGDPLSNTLDSNYVNNINNMGTVTYAPLAEGLARIGGYFDSSSSHVVGEYCQENFVIVVSPGMSSQDATGASQYVPESFSDFDGDSGELGEGQILADSTQYAIPVEYNGSTWLDDIAHYLYTNDVVGYEAGFQNVKTFTVGFMADKVSNLFLINTSNNGNGNTNLYDTTDNLYGKHHFNASSPSGLSSAILSAVNYILTQTNSFTAPVIPISRTISGNQVYLSFFTPNEGNFWEGNIVKLGIDENNALIDANGDSATWPNGSFKESAVPYWASKNWADPDYSTQDCTGPGCNYISNADRSIYTYMGISFSLTVADNAFDTSNDLLTLDILGNPTQGRIDIINYVRGADVLDEDGDGNTSENRKVMTGDILHGEPAVFEYNFPDNTSQTFVYFGANDGMLHAVLDSETDDQEVETVHGSEAWAFIPPDQLPRLKDMVEGFSHQEYVDSSPKIYFRDTDLDNVVEPSEGDQVILICGERKGGTSYFALDVTDPSLPSYLWRINSEDDTVNGSGPLPEAVAPIVVPELGETWSEPQFGRVKTTDYDDDEGTVVFFVGGGYSSDNSAGNAVLAINVFDRSVVRVFKNDGIDITDMNYSIPSSMTVLDTDNNGFVDKVYVGDLGGQMWRFGKYTDTSGSPYEFPESDENINNWEAQVIFSADPQYDRKFFYPPSVALEVGYDLIFMGTGAREDACNETTSDRVYAVKDSNGNSTFTEADLVDVTDSAANVPDLDSQTMDVDENGNIDQGWYIQLPPGEKVLSEGVVFYKAYYVTTFTPNDDPCLPGGLSKLYALGYKTGNAVLHFGGSSLSRSLSLGGGIPSKPVVVLNEGGAKLFISVGSTNPDDSSDSQQAGVVIEDPLAPGNNFHYQWWVNH